MGRGATRRGKRDDNRGLKLEALREEDGTHPKADLKLLKPREGLVAKLPPIPDPRRSFAAPFDLSRTIATMTAKDLKELMINICDRHPETRRVVTEILDRPREEVVKKRGIGDWLGGVREGNREREMEVKGKAVKEEKKSKKRKNGELVDADDDMEEDRYFKLKMELDQMRRMLERQERKVAVKRELGEEPMEEVKTEEVKMEAIKMEVCDWCGGSLAECHRRCYEGEMVMDEIIKGPQQNI